MFLRARVVGRYTAVTDVCGKSYRNCSLCDDESKYHPQGACGFHYSPAGWRLLSKQTVDYIEKAMGVVSSASKAAGTTMMKSDDDEQVCTEQQYLTWSTGRQTIRSNMSNIAITLALPRQVQDSNRESQDAGWVHVR